jgi:hypothetical protein
MIPRIQRAGGSFVGAGKYYLHDKAADKDLPKHLKPKTDERVWFSETRNCFSEDPERALKEMWHTAEDQAWLKRQAGVRAGGRTCDDPVKTLSLAWHKDDEPTPEQMIAAADAFLKHMRWHEHQAVFIAHRDTEHRHIHIIVNRVHPETGRTLDDYREQVRAQNWALAYEKEHGRVWCENREINAELRGDRLPERHRDPALEKEAEKSTASRPDQERDPALDKEAQARQNLHAEERRKPANDHLPHNVVMLTRPMQREYEEGEKSLEDLHKIDRDLLKQEQRAEREAFFKDGSKIFKAERHRIYDEIRKEYAPEWRQFFKDKAAAEKEAQQQSKVAMAQAMSFAREGRWGEAREAYENSHAVMDAVSRDFAARKADLKERQMEDLRERQTLGCDALRENRDADYKELLQRQRDERAALTATNAMGERAVDLVVQTLSIYAANENASAEAKLPDPANTNPAPQENASERTGTQDAAPASPAKAPELDVAALVSGAGETARPESYRGPDDDRLTGRRDGVDLAATAIGAAATYIADQLGEFFTPTPPELRAARALEEARREAEKPARDPARDDVWTRHIEAALRIAEQERENKRSRDYWTERERTKEGRDR